ncbi:MAG TPA: DUF885 domain-containing protein [Candidatus Udaeobacter sp.]|jgi:uncharacterized protein (DUF885 family)|nr:DUF885 domain-containing protein [Candidatus Udaeobacter sp.]
MKFFFLALSHLVIAYGIARAQSPSERNPDVSNKALITKSTPTMTADAFKNQSVSAATAALHKMAEDYYGWQNENYPVRSSYAGLHTWDNRLTDYSPAKIAERAQHVRSLLEKLRTMKVDNWPKDERIDAILFRAQLDEVDFGNRVLKFERTNPQLYVDECTNGIFSLLKKEYDTPRKRALAATVRLRQMPAFLKQGLSNLQNPVKLYAQLAIQSARAIDPLLNQSLMALDVDLASNEHEELVKSRDVALAALHGYADKLEKRLAKMVNFSPMGEANYNYYLKHVLLLPLDAAQVEMIGRVELARYRALEALLPDPKLADPDPKRSANIPPDQASFLKAYESREAEMIDFLKEHNLVSLPDYLGAFQIRELPEAFKPTSPGGFMNPPGVYDKDPTGFYFIPAYNPQSKNFYIRAAIEDPRPILGHEGIPGHFLQLSVANHLSDEIRRQHQDGVFVEGWALYGEEMLMRTGLYPNNSPAQGQILRLSRYRAARIGVDVNLHTGRWSFEQAVKYFMEAGGLDREAAEGEAAGAASNPHQKISYIIGKWQIMNLLGRYKDRQGENFRLGQFHDDLIKNGSLPVSVIEWILLDDPAALQQATK